MLHPALQRWVWSQGWRSLREVQERSIAPVLRGGQDVLIAAETAGGKTEAAFLPALSRVASDPQPGIRVLGISPLKALINDQCRRLEEMAEPVGLEVHRWHGDVSASRKAAVARRPNGVLLITPESLEALFVRRGTQLRSIFMGLSCVIIDELHAFIGSERGRQLQSLLCRLENAIGRRADRIAMSATLGDMGLAAEFLRPGGQASAFQVLAPGGGSEVQLQVRGYLGESPDFNPDIAGHLYKVLRGRRHLVFVNQKSRVEAYSACLREACETHRVPNEFWPHHGSLSKELREEAEHRLRIEDVPTTVVCSSTLELGIDIGDVETVAQIGGPISVGSMRQRLGRSGRRGAAAVLRTYIEEAPIGPRATMPDLLRWELVETMAMVELLVQRWIEPPDDRALHLSTLVQQTLSAIAQHGGRRAEWLWQHLCGEGAFGRVNRAMFAALLRAIASRDLIVQSSDGILLLGVLGEKFVNHYEFYAAFSTPEEYRVEHEGRPLGALPVYHSLIPGGMLTFAGRRWVILAVSEEQKTIEVKPGPSGPVPHFLGGGAPVHDRVRQEMFRLYVGKDVPAYLDSVATTLLHEGRGHFGRLRLQERTVVQDASGCWLFMWCGDKTLDAVAAMLQVRGLGVESGSGCIKVSECTEDALVGAIEGCVFDSAPTAAHLASVIANKRSGKWDWALSDDLMAAECAVRDLDCGAALNAMRRVLAGHSPLAG